jgi:hypothetical protein
MLIRHERTLAVGMPRWPALALGLLGACASSAGSSDATSAQDDRGGVTRDASLRDAGLPETLADVHFADRALEASPALDAQPDVLADMPADVPRDAPAVLVPAGCVPCVPDAGPQCCLSGTWNVSASGTPETVLHVLDFVDCGDGGLACNVDGVPRHCYRANGYSPVAELNDTGTDRLFFGRVWSDCTTLQGYEDIAGTTPADLGDLRADRQP